MNQNLNVKKAFETQKLVFNELSNYDPKIAKAVIATVISRLCLEWKENPMDVLSEMAIVTETTLGAMNLNK